LEQFQHSYEIIQNKRFDKNTSTEVYDIKYIRLIYVKEKGDLMFDLLGPVFKYEDVIALTREDFKIMNVKEKFIQLTSKTYPHGHEQELFDLLPSYLKQDEFGNLYHQIGDNPTTMFTSHLDTASYDYSVVNHVVKDNIIYSDGSTILGADDKAGVVILIYMMEYNIPGLYYFFLGEERGCIGSRKLSAVHQNKPINGIKKVVSFDRRGTDSVITHQVGGRCCSQDFAKELSHQLNSVSKNLFNKPRIYRS
jgi:hypothetical protein